MICGVPSGLLACTHFLNCALLHEEEFLNEAVLDLSDILKEVFKAIYPVIIAHLLISPLPELRLEYLYILVVRLNLKQHLV